jgi:hypothetical protein
MLSNIYSQCLCREQQPYVSDAVTVFMDAQNTFRGVQIIDSKDAALTFTPFEMNASNSQKELQLIFHSMLCSAKKVFTATHAQDTNCIQGVDIPSVGTVFIKLLKVAVEEVDDSLSLHAAQSIASLVNKLSDGNLRTPM